ncbi:hypothetical protein [Rothia sp. L_38]|uniref:hypothetical protein n=1 Tax=Rothia sp. L_38 TaxID=3422315 RepID=UPI003D6BFC63
MTTKFSRRLFLSGLSAGTVAGFSACGQEKIERIVPTETATAATSSAAASGSDPRKWSHYGDSFTASGLLAQELEALTGYTHISAGVAGDTSMAGAFRAGALELEVGFENNLIPAEEPALVTAMSIEPNPIAANYWHYPCEVLGVNGYLMREYGVLETYFYRDSPGNEIHADPMNAVYLDPATPTNTLTEGTRGKYSLIVGFGRNDIDTRVTSEQTVQYIRDILETNTDTGARHLVWDVPPWVSEPIGSEARQPVDEINSLLEESFGEIFIKPVRWIIENPVEAFNAAKIGMTERDQTDIDNGVIPESFRIDDMGHFNEAGARAWAHAVYQEIKKRGW